MYSKCIISIELPPGGGVLSVIVCYVCAAVETPIFTPEFQFQSIMISPFSRSGDPRIRPFPFQCIMISEIPEQKKLEKSTAAVAARWISH